MVLTEATAGERNDKKQFAPGDDDSARIAQQLAMGTIETVTLSEQALKMVREAEFAAVGCNILR